MPPATGCSCALASILPSPWFGRTPRPTCVAQAVTNWYAPADTFARVQGAEGSLAADGGSAGDDDAAAAASGADEGKNRLLGQEERYMRRTYFNLPWQPWNQTV